MDHEDLVDTYTQGLCWSLAWELHKLGDWPMYTLEDDSSGWWNHVVVKVDRNKYLDIEGIRSRREVMHQYHAKHLRRVPECESRKAYQKEYLHLMDWEMQDYDVPFTRKTAKALVKGLGL